jgi:hypothetical protein
VYDWIHEAQDKNHWRNLNKHSNEHSAYMTEGEFWTSWVITAFQERLCSLELVHYGISCFSADKKQEHAKCSFNNILSRMLTDAVTFNDLIISVVTEFLVSCLP